MTTRTNASSVDQWINRWRSDPKNRNQPMNLDQFPLNIKLTQEIRMSKTTRDKYLSDSRRRVDDLLELIAKKNSDYTQGAEDDAFANFRTSEEVGIPMIKGLHLRMSDKWQRVKSFQSTGNLKGESVKDAYYDLIGYSLLALSMLEELEG